MKKILLVAGLALFGTASAQMEKGSWVVGGSTAIGFNNLSAKVKVENTTEETPSVNIFTLTPSVGYFATDNLAVGLDAGFANAGVSEDGTKISVNLFTLMPTGTYYFKSGNNIVPYLGAGIGYATASVNVKFDSTTETESVDGFAWKAKGGFVYLLNQNVGIDLGVGYTNVTHNNSAEDLKVGINSFGVNAGVSVFLK